MMKLYQFATRRCFSASTLHVPIAIVGGGPAGLFLSNLLSTYNTRSILLEARSAEQLFAHPQAHFLNTRTMEIMRHSLPDLYRKVCQAMPPVEEWRYFSFGNSAAGEMARVVHPVDRPLRANSDANGTLLPIGQIHAEPTAHDDNDNNNKPLSVCSVGHLAQHIFSKLLYESSMDLLHPESEVRLESPVQHIVWDNGYYKLTTKSGSIVYADIVVAADGSHSKTRQDWNIEWGKGREGIQHLINVHIRTTVSIEPSAMLYAIYNDDCVAMMVRHSSTEYVLQVPYFPPYQSLERHFTHKRVTSMLIKIMNTSDFDIISIRPWVMSSLVASQYTDGKAGVLLGDAAHIFPPAGGFGMNTGLQDAFNLAWRLASSVNHGSNLRQHLQEYQSERHAIARDNAALSVRNFERVLSLAKSCYLYDQHPALLMQVLDRMPLSLATRQDIFTGLLQTALAPLKALKDLSTLHARHVTSRLRSILQRGGGLPLLFPKYELGFGYQHPSNPRAIVGTNDSFAGDPRVQVGHLFPHVALTVISDTPRHANIRWISPKVLTTSDLPCQLREREPCFVLLVVAWTGELIQLQQVAELVHNEFGLKTMMVHVVKDPIGSESQSGDLTLWDSTGDLHNFTTGLVLIRPDGHICHVGHDSNSLELNSSHNTSNL
jgi:2-polyprenyl-6-methoxyphenol hydroxylase-like FAD-dependent oxidoreductase